MVETIWVGRKDQPDDVVEKFARALAKFGLEVDADYTDDEGEVRIYTREELTLTGVRLKP